MITSTNSIYEFGPFRIDTERYLLMKGEQTIPLSPKVFETLLYLIQNRGRVARKDEIISGVWPDTFVEEGNLPQNIFLLRKALSEEKNEHHYIVTIPGIGYRFVADVREIQSPAGSTVSELDKTVSSIAVLPFKSLAPDEDEKFLGPGLADALIMRLSSIRNLKVRPTGAVLKFNNLSDDPLLIGRELNVDALLDGVYQWDSEKIRVSTQLVSVKDGITLWAAKFDERVNDIFSIQDSISEQVANSLSLKLSGDERRQIKQGYTQDPEAFQLFIKGRFFWNQRTTEGLRKALDLAQQAIAIDPMYAPAYVGLSDAYCLLGAQYNVLAPRDSFPKARAAALRALEIDPNMAEAYSSLGFIDCCFNWDWHASEEGYLKAIELKPNYPTAHHWYGELLTILGRFNEAAEVLQTAQELDSLSLAINVDLAASFYYARDFRRSERQLHNLLELNPRFVRALTMLGRVYDQLGEYDLAVETLEQAVAVSGNDPVTRSALALTLARGSGQEKAKALLTALQEESDHRYISTFGLGLIRHSLGEVDISFEYFEKAFESRDVELVFLKVNPALDSLRSDTRFESLVTRVGLS